MARERGRTKPHSWPSQSPKTEKRRAFLGPAEAPLVLVVDFDDRRDVYADVFAAAGLRVATAVDGEHALWKVDAFHPSVVVMSLALPGMNGCEATRRLKATPRTRHIHVIAVEPESPDALLQASSCGADAVVGRACSPEALLAVVMGLLPPAR